MKTLLRCSFCGKSELEIAKLAAGPGGLHICDECVSVCQLVMEGDFAAARTFDPTTWLTDRLIAVLDPINATIQNHRLHLGNVVGVLRSRDVSWARIAKPLGISRQSACERFGGDSSS